MIDSLNTIVALSTATGGALSVIRLSGSNSLEIVSQCFKAKLIDRNAVFGNFYDKNGDKVDEVVSTYFKAPRSYTGEDMIEISCHGSQWISSEIIRVLIQCGASMASAGEFTKRAFLNGKMDLSQSEAVADLIVSQSKASARVALSQMRGGYSVELSELRGKLLNVKALLELELDFGEEDVEFASRDDLRTLLQGLKERCAKLADSFSLGNVLRRGVSVAIVGNPNVGKSTLLNQLVGEERAIVSNIAGTTRDYIEEVVVIDGVEFRFVDTAGIRHTDDEIEAMGIERSLESMQRAEIVIQLIDSEEFERIEVGESQHLLVVRNKSDKQLNSEMEVSNSVADKGDSTTLLSKFVDLRISAKMGKGVDDLRKELVRLSGVGGVNYSEMLVVSNERHYELLRGVVESCEESLGMIEGGMSGDLISYGLGRALEQLGEITGEFTSDEVLATIFSSFCIGK